MKCWICKTSFAWNSYSGPAEPCDCGMEVTTTEYREASPERAEELHELRRDWSVVKSWPESGEAEA